MAGQHLTGIKRLVAAGKNSLAGLKTCWLNEEAFRQEIAISIIGIPAGIYLGDNNIERVLLIGSLLVLLITELVNSAIEAAIDRISLERHELSGRAKDLGAAAVLLAAILTAVTWLLILL